MSYSHASKYKDTRIYVLKKTCNQTQIAENVGVDKSTISRELRRNKGQRGYRPKNKLKEKQKHVTKHIVGSLTDNGLCGRTKNLKGVGENIGCQKYFKIHISHEWIYQYIWKDKEAGGELYEHLRCQKKYRKRSQTGENRGKIPNQTSIEERPAIGILENASVIGKAIRLLAKGNKVRL